VLNLVAQLQWDQVLQKVALHRNVAVTGSGYIIVVFNYKVQLIKAHPVYFLRLVDLMIIACSSTDVGNDIFVEPVEFLPYTGEGSNLVDNT